jgi:hypothetical protein
MPRIRSLKIGFFQNEGLAGLSMAHRLLFEGLWLLADREGRLEDRPLRIKAQLFPYDTIDVDPLLADLDGARFIKRYTADGAAYLAVLNFAKHQRPKSDEAVSVIPAPVLGNPRGIARDGDGSPLGKDRGQRTEDREAGESRTGADGAPPAADGADLLAHTSDGEGAHLQAAEQFAEAWNRLTEASVPRCRDLTSTRKRHIRARLTERPLTEWEQIISRIQASAFCRGENDRGWRATFDWLIGSPDVGVKVLEGKYDDRPRHASERPFTPAELDRARAWRRAMGGCGHDPRCASAAECIAKFIRVRMRAEQVSA